MLMRWLLDKVIVRYTLDGMVSLALDRPLTEVQQAAVQLLTTAATAQVDLYISPASANILSRLQANRRFEAIIQVFLRRVQIATPTRYFVRWSRRLRQIGFAPEDSRMLALPTFGTNATRDILGMNAFITYDHPLVNLWRQNNLEIERRLSAMRRQLPAPYDGAKLPKVMLLK